MSGSLSHSDVDTLRNIRPDGSAGRKLCSISMSSNSRKRRRAGRCPAKDTVRPEHMLSEYRDAGHQYIGDTVRY